MVTITISLLTLKIVLGLLYILGGFITYGLALSTLMNEDYKKIEKLGLSLEGFKYKRNIKNSMDKICLLVICLAIWPYRIYLVSRGIDLIIDDITSNGFRIW